MNHSVAFTLEEDRSSRYCERCVFAREINRYFLCEFISREGILPMSDMCRCTSVSQPIIQLMDNFISERSRGYNFVIVYYIDEAVFGNLICDVLIMDRDVG